MTVVARGENDLESVPRSSFKFELGGHHSLESKERKAEKVFFL